MPSVQQHSVKFSLIRKVSVKDALLLSNEQVYKDSPLIIRHLPPSAPAPVGRDDDDDDTFTVALLNRWFL